MVTPLARGTLLRLAAEARAATPAEIVGSGGGVLVVIPHPDDESLAMGRLLAALIAEGRAVVVALLTDGGGSHASPRLGHDGLVRLRRRELREALRRLGGAEGILAFGHPDPGAPDQPTAEEVERLARVVSRHGLRRVLTCWRGDPHVDHQNGAVWADRLCEALGLPPPIEAPVWGRFVERAPDEGQRLLRFEGHAYQADKARAVAAHRSQMSGLVPDDPEGFVMTPETRAHFIEHPELFLVRDKR